MDEQRDSTRRILKLNRIRFELDIPSIQRLSLLFSFYNRNRLDGD